MRIAIIVEGKTEKVFKPVLTDFIRERVEQAPRLNFVSQDGRIPKGDRLKRMVSTLLSGPSASDHVIALTDVYTGTRDFLDAADARGKMRGWVGQESRFHPHAAQHDFEAWLIPYWPAIQKIAKSRKGTPGANPETVNHDKPPAYHLREVFEAGGCRDSYIKVRDAKRILDGQDLMVSIQKCAELKAFVNTVLELSSGAVIP